MALKRAIKFIRYRPRSRGETGDRLRRWGYQPEVAEPVLNHLQDIGLIDDTGFARAFMEELVNKGLGYHRVRGKLLGKRLDVDIVNEVMSEYPHDKEAERALKVGSDRLARLSDNDLTLEYKKLRSFLVRKGFQGQVAEQVCKQLILVDTEFGPE